MDPALSGKSFVVNVFSRWLVGWLNGWIQEHIIEGEGKPDWLAG